MSKSNLHFTTGAADPLGGSADRRFWVVAERLFKGRFKYVTMTPGTPFNVNSRPSYARPPYPPASPQPKGVSARKTSTVNIPTLDEQQAKPVHPDNSAPGILAKARQHQLDRAATYDKPAGERSMAQTVLAFNALAGRTGDRALGEDEGWLLMDCLKTVRDRAGVKPHQDSLEDKVAYASLYAESRLRDAGSASFDKLAKSCENVPYKSALGRVSTATLRLVNGTVLTYTDTGFPMLRTVGEISLNHPICTELLLAVHTFKATFTSGALKSLLAYTSDVQRIPEIPLDRLQATYDLIIFTLNLPRKPGHVQGDKE